MNLYTLSRVDCICMSVLNVMFVFCSISACNIVCCVCFLWKCKLQQVCDVKLESTKSHILLVITRGWREWIFPVSKLYLSLIQHDNRHHKNAKRVRQAKFRDKNKTPFFFSKWSNFYTAIVLLKLKSFI